MRIMPHYIITILRDRNIAKLSLGADVGVWNKIQAIIISRYRISNPLHLPLYIGGSLVSISKSIKLLGATLEEKLTFEDHLLAVSSSIAQKTDILCKCIRTFCDNDTVFKTFISLFKLFSS